jgi:probable rRNA maturation factor
MTVDVSELPPLPSGVSIEPQAVGSFADAILQREGVDPAAVLTVAFVDRETIAGLNEIHMGKKGTTDVLSFPIEDAAPGAPPSPLEEGPPLLLGDVVICADIVAEHAVAYGIPFDDELYLMVCHGVLHILGWDHATDEEAELMEAREAEHLATMGRTRR